MSLHDIVYYSVALWILTVPSVVIFFIEPNILSKRLIFTYLQFYPAKSISASTTKIPFYIVAPESNPYKPVNEQTSLSNYVGNK